MNRFFVVIAPQYQMWLISREPKNEHLHQKWLLEMMCSGQESLALCRTEHSILRCT